MRLLIVTQTVDRTDPFLGFFHRWLEVFAARFETIEVICLREGEHQLPANVRVHSLGKEKGGNRLLYTLRFYKQVWKLRRAYDAVFVHMNPEYIVLAGSFWKFSGKRIGLWYNHTVGSGALRVAAPIVDVIFHTSPYAATAPYAQAKLMPAGIDTEVFKPSDVPKMPGSIYFQGRIAPAKNVHLLLEAFERLYGERKVQRLTLVGPEDAAYVTPLKEKYRAFIAQRAVVFSGPQRHEETPKLYSTHEVSVNLTARGNYDKTVLESLACGTPVITASDAFDGIPGVTRIPQLSVSALTAALMLPRPDITEAHSYVIKHHGLNVLADELARSFV